jgi:transcriptional regulator with XRE-family HTH domain
MLRYPKELLLRLPFLTYHLDEGCIKIHPWGWCSKLNEADILLIRVLFSRYRFLSIFGSMEASTKSTNPNIGRKIGRIRELRGIKQETLAEELGVSQQTVSRMEQSEVVEKELLEKVARILGVSPDAIKNFSEEAVINYFNTFNDSSINGAVGSNNNHCCTFHPLDKLMEVIEENKKLYERLLASEREKIDLLKGKQ